MAPQTLFSIGPVNVNFYLMAHFLVIFPMLALALWLGRERGIPGAIVADGWLVTVIARGAISPALTAILASATGADLPWNWSVTRIVVGLSAVSLYLRLRRGARPYAGAMWDVVALCMLLDNAIARLGCFAAGCCHGRPAFGLPWAVTFNDPQSACAFLGLPVHPTQLYEVGAGLLALGGLLLLRRRPFWRGRMIWASIGAYAVIRFVVDFYRGDVRPMAGGLTMAQATSLLLFIVCAVMLLRHLRLATRPAQAAA